MSKGIATQLKNCTKTKLHKTKIAQNCTKQKKAPEQQLQAFSYLIMDKKMKLSKLAQTSILKKAALIFILKLLPIERTLHEPGFG